MRTVIVIMECVGPRCMKIVGFTACKIKSMSGNTETTRRRGRFSLVLKTLDVLLPVKYPRAK